MYTLGFVGTAKNTGKTTTALHILNLLKERECKIALTSIGFDGENTDQITGLPKPRYFANQGIIIATAEKCLHTSTANFSNLQHTGIQTILGEILIAEFSSVGNVVLAGPNRRVDILILLGMLSEMGIEVTLVDGALNRLAAMSVVDSLILATGAAYDNRIPVIANHAQAMESMFHFPFYEGDVVLDDTQVFVLDDKNAKRILAYNSVLDEQSLLILCDWLAIKGRALCYIPGTFSPILFQKLIEKIILLNVLLTHSVTRFSFCT